MTNRSSSPPRARSHVVRDVVIAVCVLLIYPWLLYGLLHLIHIRQPRLTVSALYEMLSELPRALAAVVLLTKWRWWRRTGWRTPEWRQMWLLWLPVALVVWAWITRHPSNPGVVWTALAAVAALAYGSTEEMWFRGLLLEGLRPRGALRAVVLSAAAFGVFHLGNGFRGFPTVFQVLFTFGFGLIYGAARIRIGAIWPLILLHAAELLPSFLLRHGATTPSPVSMVQLKAIVIQDGLVIGVGLVYALVLTRRSRIERVPGSVQATPTIPTTASE